MTGINRKLHTALCVTAVIITVLFFALAACTNAVKRGEVSPSDFPISSSPAPFPTETVETALPVAETPVPSPLPEFSAPLLNFEGHFIFNGCYVTFPCFTGANTSGLNKALVNAFVKFACGMEKPRKINYELAFCDRGLISVWIVAYTSSSAAADGAPAETNRTAFNYDIYSGRELNLSDCFGCEYTSAYAERLAQMLTETANANAITLISKIKPVPENQIFIFSREGIKFYYRLYEIASFADGAPVLTLAYDALSVFPVTPESAIGRFFLNNG